MGQIIKLEKSVVDKIAAGEVVERPASVVKELVENSLDAGATSVEINVVKGGQEMIEVIDDGAGMAAGDVDLAIQRFATSKIRHWEDLETITTFGFRGEALPSIAAVSRLEILTRPPDSETGTKLRAIGGEVEELSETGTPPGTRVRVCDLFFNTPARKKFLKSPPAETAHITGIAQKLSLVNPDASFKLTSNGRTVFDFPSTMTVRERVLRIWGLPLDYEVIPVEDESSTVRVAGYVCKPDKLKSHRTYQLVYVNDRFIKNRMINQAIAEGFSPLLPAGKFPIALLFINVKGSEVDFNVHPNKMEVRFTSPGSVFRVVRDAIKRQLRNFGFSPTFPPQQPGGFKTSPTSSRATFTSPGGNISYKKEMQADTLPLDFQSPGLSTTTPAQKPPQQNGVFRALAQVKKTYILGKFNDEIWICDQHTAHERINYEKLFRIGEKTTSSQQLLFPIMLELPPTLFNFIEDKLEKFREIGFEIEHFGSRSVLVKAVPLAAKRLENKETLMAIFEEVARGQPYTNLEALYDRIRSTVACKASIKSGDVLELEEMNALVNELINMDYSSFCPHGRPVVIKLSGEHLDRMFHRI